MKPDEFLKTVYLGDRACKGAVPGALAILLTGISRAI
ncbi:DUF6258 family protein [Ensifer adhaerens]